MSTSPPTTLGQYQIIREIARSNDIVYEAYDPLMNRRVAVKELSMPAGMTDAQKQDRISRFKREAQAAGTLNHPNIMTVYSFAEDAGRTFMAMEFLDGHTLRNEIDTKGFLAPERAAEIAIEVLEGLGHAHSKGVIHRDIKPDNIQILANGQVKITDFGIARLTFQPNLTMDGQVFGTPSYMSPEQVVGRDIDARSDLFSVAVVLYEMLSGQKPFAGDSVVSITYAIMNKEPQQPNQIDWALWQVLSRALDKSPQLRYSNASDMVDAIRNARKQAQSGLMGGSPGNVTGSYMPGHPNNPPNVYTSPYANPSAGYAQLSPQAPPVQPPPVYGQPYNPYQAPVQQPPVSVPPPQYPYNPYQPSSQITGYSPMAGMPPPPAIPVYYPPPPRTPLVKPDTVIFLKKFFVATILLGTMLTFIFVMIGECSKQLTTGTTAVRDQEIASQIRALNPRIPLEERIQKAQDLQNQLPKDNRTQTDKAVAVLLAEQGNTAMRRGDSATAESYLVDANQLDPTPSRLEQISTLYQSMSNRALDTDRARLLEQSGEAILDASKIATDSVLRTRYQDRAAQSFFTAAQTLANIDPSQTREIRRLLNRAREAAPPNSSIRGQIDQAAAWIRNP